MNINETPRTSERSQIINFVVMIASSVLLAILVALGGVKAAHAQAGNTYGNAQLLGSVQPAQVIQVRLVTSTANQSWTDQAAGAAIGGALGAAIGNRASDNNRALTTTLGTLLGGVAGTRIAERMVRNDAQEIILRTASGQMLAVVQPAPFDAVMAGEQVLLLSQAGQYRIIRSTGFVQQPQVSPMLPTPQQQGFQF